MTKAEAKTLANQFRAAVIVGGREWVMPRPNRHSDVFHLVWEKLGLTVGAESGFVDNSRKFYTHQDAFAIAKQAGLVTGNAGVLFTEDLW